MSKRKGCTSQRTPSSGAGTTSLARSEEELLQPKVILTNEQMFLGTVYGTNPISNVMMEERDGEMVPTYDYGALSVALGEFRAELNREFSTIPVSKITKAKALQNCWTGLTIVHRSGIFSTADVLGNVFGGSDWLTVHWECIR